MWVARKRPDRFVGRRRLDQAVHGRQAFRPAVRPAERPVQLPTRPRGPRRPVVAVMVAGGRAGETAGRTAGRAGETAGRTAGRAEETAGRTAGRAAAAG